MAGPKDGLESRTIAEVQASTRFILDSFRAKMTDLKDKGADMNKILRFGVDLPSASSTAGRFFGGEEVRYVAIDGTESVDEQLDLLVFYVGAFAYSGVLDFRGGGVSVGEPVAEESGFSVSAAIPISEEDAAAVYGEKKESGVEVDSERLPGSLMHLAEYFLAYTLLKQDPRVKVLLLDRTLAGDVSHLVWSTRDLVAGRSSVLLRAETSKGEVSPFDLELARIMISNDDLGIPAPRSHLLKFAALKALFSGESLTAGELVAKTGGAEGRTPRLEDDLRELAERHGVFEEFHGVFRLKPGVSGYWERVLEATLSACDRIFHPEEGHPLRVPRAGGEAWVTADDLDFMVLVLIQAILRHAWDSNVLPIGLIKDTSASELAKAAVPVLLGSGLLEGWPPLPAFESDKMLLQTNSVVNSKMVPTPWHTFDLDASFRTMAPVHGPRASREGVEVVGAYGNIIYPERVFVKTYIQLWSSSSSPEVRSHVFTYDRPVFASFDHWDEVVLFNRDGTVEEEVRPVLHFGRDSEMTNLAMAILSEMSGEAVPEALGHNYPLFLADKKAKSVLEQTKAAYLGAVAVEMARSDLDQQVLFSRRFRDYRSQVEGRRKS